MQGELYEEGDNVIVVKIEKLPGNSMASPLKMGNKHVVLSTTTCSCGKQHLNLGLASEYNSISCHSCKKDLKDGDKIHWCHPSCVKLI